jgi:hypothetical protein
LFGTTSKHHSFVAYEEISYDIVVGLGGPLVRSGISIDLYTLVISVYFTQNVQVCPLFTSVLGYNLLLFGVYHAQGDI